MDHSKLELAGSLLNHGAGESLQSQGLQRDGGLKVRCPVGWRPKKGAAKMHGDIIPETGIDIDTARLEPAEEWTPRDFVR